MCLNNRPFISFIIPAYNVSDYIHFSLNSILNQTDRDFEIIIVDDASTDNTLKKIDEIMKITNVSWKLVKHKINKGVSAARNTGMRHANGKYIMFLDADDYVSKDFIETIKKEAIEDVDMIIFGYNEVYPDGSTKRKFTDLYSYPKCNSNGICKGEEILIEATKIKTWIWTGSAVYKTNFLKGNNLKYTEGCKYAEDIEFTWKALFLANKVKVVEKVLSYYVQRRTSAVNSVSGKIKNESYKHIYGVLERLEKFFKDNGADCSLINSVLKNLSFIFTNHTFLFLKHQSFRSSTLNNISIEKKKAIKYIYASKCLLCKDLKSFIEFYIKKIITMLCILVSNKGEV